MHKWTIQVTYDANGEDGKKFRARSVFQTEANDPASAYQNAIDAFRGRDDVKLGAIICGHYSMIWESE